MLVVLCLRKRNRQIRQNVGVIDPEPSFVTNLPVQSDILNNWSPTTLLPADIDMDGQASKITLSPPPVTSPMLSKGTPTSTATVVATPNNDSSPSGQFLQPTEAQAMRVLSDIALVPTSTNSTGRLTEEQSEVVQGLIKHKVPLPIVVEAIEGILRVGAEGQSDGSEGYRTRLTQSDGHLEADSPPDYRFV
jgi:hypothetical protein